MTQAAEVYPITFEQGTPFQLVYTWTDNNGNPVDVTGYSAKLKVVTDLINKVQILNFVSSGSGTPNTSIVLGGAAGTVTVNATAAATGAMNFDTGYYALLVESAGAEITKLLEGTVTVGLGLSW